MRRAALVASILAAALTIVGCDGALRGPNGSGSASGPSRSQGSSPTETTSPPPPTERPSLQPNPEATGSIITATSSLAPTGLTETAQVLRVIDGDTIEVDRGRGPERVRYIGVDTPESVKPGTPVEPYAKEAAAFNESLVADRDVVLERDISESDKYGRLLRYVWVEEPDSASGWTFVNLALLAAGFAQVVTCPPDVEYVDLYLEAQRAARESGRGLWADEPVSVPVQETPTGSCDPAYPDVCIAPPPPDVDCGDISYRRFQVLPPDPHNFDGDHDGIGCESG